MAAGQHNLEEGDCSFPSDRLSIGRKISRSTVK